MREQAVITGSLKEILLKKSFRGLSAFFQQRETKIPQVLSLQNLQTEQSNGHTRGFPYFNRRYYHHHSITLL